VRIAVFAVGEKGRAFLAAILDDDRVVVVAVRSYPQSAVVDDAQAGIDLLCQAHGVPIHRGARGDLELGPDVDLIFVVGWQYLLPPDPRMVVFHDSLLPRLRGFAPTVTALILGDTEVGVTALRPVAELDAGPVLAQHAQTVTYPAKIRDVLHLLADSYVACAGHVISSFAAGSLEESAQDPDAATYSIWRGDDDYIIDWTEDADRIRRTVDALGWPYPGAHTRLEGSTLTILDVAPGPDLRFEIRQPGKVWSVADGIATVVCGSGTLILTDVRDSDGLPFRFERLRVRLG